YLVSPLSLHDALPISLQAAGDDEHRDRWGDCRDDAGDDIDEESGEEGDHASRPVRPGVEDHLADAGSDEEGRQRQLDAGGCGVEVRDLTDRRRITLALTSKASENLERVREEWRRTVSGADIDPDDLDAAFRVLRAIDSWIGKGASSS